MTSKEAIEELKTVLLTNKGTEKYADIFIENLIIPIEKDLEFLESIKKCIWKSGDNYYIDLCISRYGDTKNIYELLEQCGFEIKEK